MYGSRRIVTLAVLAGVVALGEREATALSFDQNATPTVIFGSGNVNGFYSVDRQDGVELGIRAKVRFDLASDSPQNTFNSNGAGSYSHAAGAPAAQPARARWSFEWTVNTNHDGSSGLSLDDLTYEINIDYDPSGATNFLTFDPITPTVAIPAWDHSIGTNATLNGQGVETLDPGIYAARLAANNVAQNSWQLNFFPGPAPFVPGATGIYTIALTAFQSGSPVASTAITVYVGTDSTFTLRSPVVPGPDEPVKVFLDLSSLRAKVASVGARLTYDAAKFTFVSMARGADAPATWSFAYQNTATPGLVDLVLTDQTALAAVILGPVDGAEVVSLTFDRIGVNCNTGVFGYNAAAPVTPVEISAFPENQYLHYIDASTSSVLLDEPSLHTVAGGSVDDHAFIRGNVNNRAAHALDIGDVNDLANSLFGSLPVIACAAAYDTNNDGLANITDLVTLVQGVFNSVDVTIRPPNFANPGLGIPGVVVPDGGLIPSILGCAEGETCP